MTHPEFIAIKQKHVGKKVIKAFGKRWRVNSRILPEEVIVRFDTRNLGGFYGPMSRFAV